tara:strand:- start:536 stop:1192 length:657 start_codon:yes stop_codon:yes gene_type:complete
MGINSQEVSYGFGQFGSAFTDTADAPIYPPKDLVIVAITFLADTQLEVLGTNAGGLTSDLVADTGGTSQSLWIGTDIAAHDLGNHEDADAHNDNGSNDTGVITVDAASALIKAGMIVEHETMCPRDLVNPYIVKSVSGTSVTLAKRNDPRTTAAVAANYATGSSAQKAQFYDPRSQGFGGKIVDNGNTFPEGVTIYGRWTAVEIGTGKTGALIAYFGV